MNDARIAERAAKWKDAGFFKHLQVDMTLLDKYDLPRAVDALNDAHWRILRPVEPTYENLTREFIHTVHDPHADSHALRFSLRGRSHTMSSAAINEAFGRPVGGITSFPGGDEEASAFWASIAKEGVDWSASRATNSKIGVQWIRFLQYVVSNTIHARRSPEKVSLADLVLLWGICQAEPVDVGYIWSSLVLSRVKSVTQKNTGLITYGPYVTLIAKRLRVIPKKGMEDPNNILYRPLTFHLMTTWKFQAKPEHMHQLEDEELDAILEDREPDDDVDAVPPVPPPMPPPVQHTAGPSSSRVRQRDTWDMNNINDSLAQVLANQAALSSAFTDWQTQDALRWETHNREFQQLKVDMHYMERAWRIVHQPKEPFRKMQFPVYENEDEDPDYVPDEGEDDDFDSEAETLESVSQGELDDVDEVYSRVYQNVPFNEQSKDSDSEDESDDDESGDDDDDDDEEMDDEE